MMKIKNELKSVFQLLGLLCLLFWSFTWNIPKDFDLSKPKRSLKSAPGQCLKDISDEKEANKHSAFPEQFKSGKHFGINGGYLLPPFNVWKEIELRKQEVKNVRDRISVPKVPRRKLNYASAKCGAKILTSNRESKHRMSILNEKVDEYMLNPCGIKVWFIVELCDTIEVSQIELANYELYSSMPKDFSVFWSNVYPTQTWHHLGTFQAKNQRTMQTFNIDFQNLGKFIKVVISSHHGREHFCPLSVFRVVGYSMVYEYEVIQEEKEQKKSKNDSKMNGAEPVVSEEPFNSSKIYSSIKQITLHTKPDSNPKGGSFPVKLCRMMQEHCSTSRSINASWYQPTCLFLETVIFKGESPCAICIRELPTKNFITASDSKVESRNLYTNGRSESYNKDNEVDKSIHVANKSKILNRKTQNSNGSTSSSRKIDEKLINFSIKELSRSIDKHYPSQINAVNSAVDSSFHKNGSVSQTGRKVFENIQQTKEKISFSESQCDCSKVSSTDEKTLPKQNSTFEDSLFEADVADSAALIQKESVLVKMNLRIKTLESNLSLINRYLQQLSESYRMQVEDMLTMFDGTIKAITMTSAKAAIVDKQQQLVIDQLDRKVNILSMKIQHLGNGQSDILKQVLELHGFFVILEIIIMSTIFSVFFNKFKRDGLA
ncbi:SUN domain-containing ossification factor-like [Argiope bruennichi]|uniref:SUN domain-containing ossification factor-like n=1 Tax=Argiope bruennichi TaxID=94029 RepID=UPI0024952D55|nr:SUN domain-containing ossification factor-like [Argiope bruennichi]